MAKFEVDIELFFDSELPLLLHNEVTRNVVNDMCPRSVGLDCNEKCSMDYCGECWKTAVERGACADARFIHVRRLD